MSVPRSLDSLVCAVAVVLGGSGSARAGDVFPDPPDLIAMSIEGPDQALATTQIVVHFEVAAKASLPIDPYTVEVVLSADAVVSADDIVVLSQTGTEVGVFAVPVLLPDVPAGFYCFGLRIDPVPDEPDTSDNDVIGPPTQIAVVDLVVDDDPMVVFVRANDAEAPAASVVVTNGGSPGSVLFYTVECDAAFVEIPSAQGFAVADEPGNEMPILIHHQGLPIGDHETIVVVRNLLHPKEQREIPLTVSVGDAKFNAGDRIHGLISTPGDSDEIVFDAVEGMTLRIKARTSSGDIKPILTLVDPDGEIEQVVKLQHVDFFVKKPLTVKKSGEYRLVISGAGDTFGNYKVKTGRTLSKKAQPRTIEVTDSLQDVQVHALAGATLSFTVSPSAAFTGPAAVELSSPTGGLFDLTANAVLDGTGKILVEGLVLEEAGVYSIRVLGFAGGAEESAQVHVVPVQPKKTKNKLFLP